MTGHVSYIILISYAYHQVYHSFVTFSIICFFFKWQHQSSMKRFAIPERRFEFPSFRPLLNVDISRPDMYLLDVQALD